MNNMENLEFISLKDFLSLPFINQYSKCSVLNEDDENYYIDTITIKDLLIELKDGMYEEIQEDYYVSIVMPGLSFPKGEPIDSRWYIYIKRF